MQAPRLDRLREIVRRRQLNLTVILENVHDTHNVGAVMRSCDSVGIQELFVLYTEPIKQHNKIVLGKRTSAGTRKWLDVHLYTDLPACMQHVKERYEKLYSTHLAHDAVSVYDLPLTESVALLFGNEKDGVSQEALAYADGNFHIPQMGVTKSLNISVACAVTLYEAYRQRQAANMYTHNPTMTPAQEEALFAQYLARNEQAAKGKLYISTDFAGVKSAFELKEERLRNE